MKIKLRTFLFSLTLLCFFSNHSRALPDAPETLRIVLYSGTFDPPHLGHYAIVKAAQMDAHPDLSFIIPNPTSDHKEVGTAYAERTEMAKLNFKDLPQTFVGDEELKSAFLKNDMGGVIESLERKYPKAKIFQVMGDDSYLRYLKATKNRVDPRIELLVALRQKGPVSLPHSPVPMHLIEQADKGYSSTEVRKEIALHHHPQALHSEVALYIEKKGLYRSGIKSPGSSCAEYLERIFP